MSLNLSTLKGASINETGLASPAGIMTCMADSSYDTTHGGGKCNWLSQEKTLPRIFTAKAQEHRPLEISRCTLSKACPYCCCWQFSVLAAEPPLGWRETARIPAAEAHQAAAADREFFYAVTNAKVVKYTRDGKQVAVSTGPGQALEQRVSLRRELALRALELPGSARAKRESNCSTPRQWSEHVQGLWQFGGV